MYSKFSIRTKSWVPYSITDWHYNIWVFFYSLNCAKYEGKSKKETIVQRKIQVNFQQQQNLQRMKQSDAVDMINHMNTVLTWGGCG